MAYKKYYRQVGKNRQRNFSAIKTLLLLLLDLPPSLLPWNQHIKADNICFSTFSPRR